MPPLCAGLGMASWCTQGALVLLCIGHWRGGLVCTDALRRSPGGLLTQVTRMHLQLSPRVEPMAPEVAGGTPRPLPLAFFQEGPQRGSSVFRKVPCAPGVSASGQGVHFVASSIQGC